MKNGTAVDAFHLKIEIKSLTWNQTLPNLIHFQVEKKQKKNTI